MLVVKVGGSLLDLPDLAERLQRFLAERADPDWLLVPGGGAAADLVRTYDRTHGLGEERSHWLALRACTLNAHLLQMLLDCPVVTQPRGHRGGGVLDALAFALADVGLPHCWEATSDSVAARAAIAAGAVLVLLKSVTVPPETSWEEAARAGHVDPLLPVLARQSQLRVEVVNLRQ